MSNSSVCSILDIPDEILVKIILQLDPIERLALGNSCQRFNDLVFCHEELLRNLDFSGESQLTKESDIQQYFNDENTYKRILGLNIENVKAERMLISSIGKAINLVDLNILNVTKFVSEQELHNCLEPLVHLKRLSVNWSIAEDNDDAIGNKLLEKSLGRLTYLSIKVERYSREFLFTLQFCQKLEELRIVTLMPIHERDVSSCKIPMRLRNLNVVQFRGINGSYGLLKNDYLEMIWDPVEWTDFYLVDPLMAGYLERNVAVHEQLWAVEKMRPPSRMLQFISNITMELRGQLFCEHLLSQVIRVTHQDVPKKFCCLSWSLYSDGQPCLLLIDEAKKLLKDPEYQISYLHFSHTINTNCDAHLLASAFPNLTELVTSRIGNETLPQEKRTFVKRLRKKGSMVAEEFNDSINPDSSFKMLIKNTSDLRSLTISPMDPYNTRNESAHWDLDALCLISRWNNLTTIRFKDIPITDGEFLVDIGRECRKLEEIILCRLGTAPICCYVNELLEMLKFCTNLKIFSICQTKIENTSAVFNELSNNTKLRQVRLMTNTDAFDSLDLASSIQRMLQRCEKLTKLVIQIDSSRNLVVDELKHALKRIVDELNRPNLQFHGPDRTASSTHHRNSSKSFFRSPLDDRQFEDYWL